MSRVRTLRETYSLAKYPGDTPRDYHVHKQMEHDAGLLAVYKLGLQHGRADQESNLQPRVASTDGES